ncbi:hypothetical protein A2Y99_01700 [Candidatus Gottesmanbacteria bacterium RBG_13_37_7]|uniref:Uncharacterized protein n=1 Tax=Candidatus Gottesmanbacteria bacterium RBG_13_37_7 TaxID=1798369 RepID=A0A1F5YI60_9BACT|nr:MAG: hypothetical protein A2Y99_01700 [Candidatus Gottesmanbacteria bacterium RBG_13_37_7]
MSLDVEPVGFTLTSLRYSGGREESATPEILDPHSPPWDDRYRGYRIRRYYLVSDMRRVLALQDAVSDRERRGRPDGLVTNIKNLMTGLRGLPELVAETDYPVKLVYGIG